MSLHLHRRGYYFGFSPETGSERLENHPLNGKFNFTFVVRDRTYEEIENKMKELGISEDNYIIYVRLDEPNFLQYYLTITPSIANEKLKPDAL